MNGWKHDFECSPKEVALTHSFPMHLFYAPFYPFQRVEKGCIVNKWVKIDINFEYFSNFKSTNLKMVVTVEIKRLAHLSSISHLLFSFVLKF